MDGNSESFFALFATFAVQLQRLGSVTSVEQARNYSKCNTGPQRPDEGEERYPESAPTEPPAVGQQVGAKDDIEGNVPQGRIPQANTGLPIRDRHEQVKHGGRPRDGGHSVCAAIQRQKCKTSMHIALRRLP